jgi:hypothetical protein
MARRADAMTDELFSEGYDIKMWMIDHFVPQFVLGCSAVRSVMWWPRPPDNVGEDPS